MKLQTNTCLAHYYEKLTCRCSTLVIDYIDCINSSLSSLFLCLIFSLSLYLFLHICQYFWRKYFYVRHKNYCLQVWVTNERFILTQSTITYSIQQIEFDQIVNVNQDDLDDSDEKLFAFYQNCSICAWHFQFFCY